MVPQLGPADDWIVKPWDPAELLARVRLPARRAAGVRG
jgi:DNA-binding response OmpR family regulator